MTVQQAEAVELAERWLRAVGTPLNEPDGVRVDHDNVGRGLEGWIVPWDNVAFLDGGDDMQRIFPPQRLIVTEPEGELREANTTPHPGFSRPVDWPGQPRYREFVDPEYDKAGFYRAGVPRKALVGWEVLHEDGRTAEQTNPKWIPGPRAVGLPRAQNRLETLLNYLELGVLSHEVGLALLFDMVVLLPWEAGEPVYEADSPRRLSAYSSPRKIPESCRWLRITVPTLVARFPGIGVVINSDAYPRAEFGAEELARVAAEYGSFPHYQPEEPQVVVEPGLDGAFDEYAAQLQEHFGLAEQPAASKHRIRLSRLTGYDLTSGERRLNMLASCWVDSNAERRAAGAAQNWPTELHANGLEARHESSGAAYPVPATFGKTPLEGAQDAHRFWHGVLGAYVGFAVGDALGSAVDGKSWSQIRQHYGEDGITAPDVVFDRAGQVSWRTQLLLFLTEGAVRGLRQDGAQLPTAMRSAHARWLVAQGMPWQQAAGPLAVEHPAPDGWLLHAPETHFHRGTPPGLPEVVQRMIADPGRDAGLHGPLTLMWALPDAVAAQRTEPLAKGWYQDPLDAGASAILAELFTGLFRRQRFVEPVWMRLQKQLDGLPATGSPHQPAIDLARNASSRWRNHLERDRDEVEAIGDGQDTASVLGRALLSAAKREYDPRLAILTAANQSGRSAMTAALTGALVGARAGLPGLPREWVEALDIADLVQEVANDAYWHFSVHNPHEERSPQRWKERYPRW